jgi:hypothetical protein
MEATPFHHFTRYLPGYHDVKFTTVSFPLFVLLVITVVLFMSGRGDACAGEYLKDKGR